MITKERPATGKLLIAQPFMVDSYFQRSVVLLTEHSKTDGSIGFILNKPTNVLVEDVLQEFPECNLNLFFGGPVQTDNIHFIHTIGEALEGSKHVKDDIYWGGNLEQLKNMLNMRMVGPDEIKFFAGYSGWDSEQLSQELNKNVWYVCGKNKNKITFNNNNDSPKLWGNVLKMMGNEYAVMANFPVDPSLN